jgi:thiamine biosynthesis lipoprotein
MFCIPEVLGNLSSVVSRHTWLLIVLVIAAGLQPLGCAPTKPLERFEFGRLCMGVQAKVVVYGPDLESTQEAAAAAFHRLNELDAMMSDYRPESELSLLSDNAGGTWRHISPDLMSVFAHARRASEVSDGAFDITVGPAVKAWRAARKSKVLPGEGELAAIRGLIDWRGVELDTASRMARVRNAGMRLDLGGIAKGYASEQAVRLLKSKGFPSSMVALAGDIAVGAPPPGEEGWRVAVSAGPKLEPIGAVLVHDASISTSGDTQQFVVISGRRYSHIVDPRTGLGTSPSRAVTLIGQDGADVDAAATACCIVDDSKLTAIVHAYPGMMAIVQDLEGDSTRTRVIASAHGQEPQWVARRSPTGSSIVPEGAKLN